MINSEKVIISYLNSKWKTYAQIPTDRPEQCVIVSTTGGTSNLFKADVQMAVKCLDTTEYKAAELAIDVCKYLQDAADKCEEIAKISCSVPYSFSLDGSPCYQFSIQLTTI